MPMSNKFENFYTLRQVSEVDKKPCFICYKPTKWVLITKTKLDFFYVCYNHLQDRGFATPISVIKSVTNKIDTNKLEAKDESKNVEKDATGNPQESKQEPNLEVQQTEKEKDVDSASAENESINSSSSSSKECSTQTQSKHYNLHRDIFQMRIRYHANRAAAEKTARLLQSGQGLPSPPSKPLP
ncbi:hypothetical protein POMI540_4688 [Schizosaccharomyces pombe]